MIQDNRTTTDPRHSRTSGEIKADIERTRSDLDSTVVAIEERLTPGQLFEEAWHFFRRRRQESTGPGPTSRLIREHPLPTTLVGIGLGLLVAESMGGGDSSSSSSGAGDALGDAGQRARGVVDDASDRARGFVDDAGDRARGAAGHVRSSAHKVGSKAGEVGEKVQHGAQRARRGLVHQAEENPLAVGATAFALGIAAGSIFPSTRWEDETMGETRDSVMREAKETGRETLDEVKEVATAAVEGAKEEAERQNLTPEGIADSAREVARKAEESGKKRAEEEGVTPEALGERISPERHEERRDPPGRRH